MEHPTREEWMDYVYGELDRRSRSRLTAHLAECRECEASVAEWHHAMGKLDAWQIPDEGPRALPVRRALQWVAAAVLLIALGYGIGRLYRSPAPDVEALRGELEASLSQKFRHELSADLEAAVADARFEIQDDLYRQLRSDVDELALQTFAVSSAVTNRLLSQFIQAYDEWRAEDQQVIVAALRELESRRLTDDALLRSDLVSLATLTEEELLRTRRDVATLLTYGRSVVRISEVPTSPNVPKERRSE